MRLLGTYSGISRAATAFVILTAGCQTALTSPDPRLPVPSSDPVPAQSTTPTASEMVALRFRLELGLPSALEHIRAVRSNPAATEDYGVPLLPAEVDEIEGRGVLAKDAVLLIEGYGAEHPDQFGGVYLDHSTGGTIVVLFTEHVNEHAIGVWDAVWPEIPGLPIRFKDVAHSLMELEAVQEDVARDTKEWAAAGIEITSIIVDTVGNRVEVGVVGSHAVAEGPLLAQYGQDRIRVAGAP